MVTSSFLERGRRQEKAAGEQPGRASLDRSMTHPYYSTNPLILRNRTRKLQLIG
jgi:hypothetical protein